MQRIYREAYSALGIKGKFNNHDWLTTYATQLIEAGDYLKAGGRSASAYLDPYG